MAVIGAGFGGVATAVKLHQAGRSNFRVFERADGPGGVWWHNTYPGCEVDVPSLAYSFSFIDYPWASTHASQQELQEYAEHVIDHFSLRDHFNFGTGVEKVRWIDDRSMWELTTEGGEVAEFDVVVSCLGMLSQPNIPDWAPGEFTGPVFHTANYRHDIDLSGKCIALVGTGST